MKKYFLKESNEEIRVGSKVKLTKPVETSYGKGTATVEVLVTESVLEQLIKDGFVKVQKDKYDMDELADTLKPYFRRFARVNHYNLEEALTVLRGIAELSSRAHLDILIETIASVSNRDKNLGNTYYCLDSIDGYKCRSISGPSSGIIFYDKKDAEAAYKLLTPFIEVVVNGK